ncbi:MAG TPA: P1 family peptidase [Acidobacteriota bacterium]|nr:P1 family peptidase [Acidobacteriota bacterium]
MRLLPSLILILNLIGALAAQDQAVPRKRIRDYGVRIGVLEPGNWNSITDVEGIRVGQVTLIEGQDIRTGITAILPHGGNIFWDKVPAAIYIGNGFGKLMGISQVAELGNIETPILLTATLNVPKVADALIEYALSLPGMENVRSINPIVGETNDGTLNNIRLRPLGREHVFRALENARSGPVDEGSVGAGTGTICYGFKGGIGTSSRVLPQELGGFTVGVLVQTNFGGILEINGAPIGRELGRYYLQTHDAFGNSSADGSCMIVVATNAPLKARNLRRLAKRAFLGMASTGSPSTNGSGDYVIAFSTRRDDEHLDNDKVSPLFQAAKEATEEAIYNSLFMATSMTGREGNRVEALPLDRVLELLRKHRLIGGE